MVDFATLDEWLDWQSRLSAREIELGLERVGRVFARLGLDRAPLVITVGGTNGKGSAVALLDHLARSAGRRTGVYTSPHLVRYNERIRIDGEIADDAAIVTAFRRVEAVRGDEPLTYFEYGTLAALAAFETARVDAVLLEVGLGGRLDATNIIDADGVIITSVSLDHEEWLGDDVESIAREKAGIMRGGRPAVFGGNPAPASLLAAAAEIGADLLLPGRDFEVTSGTGDWGWRGRRLSLSGLPAPRFGGSEQRANSAAVLALCEALGLDAWIDVERVRAMLALPGPPGRQQRLLDGPEWWFDVAHNTAAAEALSAALAAESVRGRTFAVVGMLDDKDAAGFGRSLAACVDEWAAVPLDTPRAMSPATLAAEIAGATGKPCLIAESLDAAIDRMRSLAAEGDRVVLAGSFHLVGPALETLGLYSRLD